MIVIIDYDMGNLGSIANMLRKIGTQAKISSDMSDVELADKLILAGVGAFDTGMSNLERLGLRPLLDEKVLQSKTPILGICLGMQLLTQSSEEGNLPGLCWVNAQTIRYKFEGRNGKLKVPHMGWNQVKVIRENVLFKDMYPKARYYFVHSYYVQCHDEANVVTQTYYGFDFTSSLQKDNVYGVQFHPEKSHKFGMKVLANFAESA